MDFHECVSYGFFWRCEKCHVVFKDFIGVIEHVVKKQVRVVLEPISES